MLQCFTSGPLFSWCVPKDNYLAHNDGVAPLVMLTAIARGTSGLLQFFSGHSWLTSKGPNVEHSLPWSSLSSFRQIQPTRMLWVNMSRGAHDVSSIYSYTFYIVVNWLPIQLKSDDRLSNSSPTCILSSPACPGETTCVTAKCCSWHHCCRLLCSEKVFKHIENYYKALLLRDNTLIYE